MSTYHFTIILKGLDDLSMEIATNIFDCGCDDGHPQSSAGTVFVVFDRESASLETAIKTAIADLKSGGFEIERIELAESDLAIGVA